MSTPRTPGQAPAWMDNGFPPRSFPIELEGSRSQVRPGRVPTGATSLRRSAGTPRAGKGRWIAAAAVLLALLLLVGGLLLANRGGGGKADLATGGSTTTAAVDTSTPSFELPTTVETPVSIDPVGGTPVVDTATTATVAAAVPGAPGAGVLETSVGDLTVPRVDATASPQTSRLTLRNTGSAALSYTTQSSAPALTSSPSDATIPAGGTTEVTVTINGARATAEGPFAGTLTFSGSGGSKTVQITSVVGRPPTIFDTVGDSCAAASASCSRQIRVDPAAGPNATPCNAGWLYAVVINDQSQIQSAKAVARLNLSNADAPLASIGRSGASGAYLSSPRSPVGPGNVLRFMLEAVDQFGFTVRLAQQTISC